MTFEEWYEEHIRENDTDQRLLEVLDLKPDVIKSFMNAKKSSMKLAWMMGKKEAVSEDFEELKKRVSKLEREQNDS